MLFMCSINTVHMNNTYSAKVGYIELGNKIVVMW